MAITARFFGVVSGFFSIMLWLLMAVTCSPSLTVDMDDPFADVNATRWRETFFSFNPRIFGNLWAPFCMGCTSILLHFKGFNVRFITRSWFRFALWNIAQALFGNFGYCGGMGFLVAAISLVTAVLAVVVGILHSRIPVSGDLAAPPVAEIFFALTRLLSSRENESAPREGSESGRSATGGSSPARNEHKDTPRLAKGERDAERGASGNTSLSGSGSPGLQNVANVENDV